MIVPVGYPEGIVEARSVAKEGIDIAAGSARGRYITTVPGQESTYLEKYDDVKRWIADGKPADLTDYPLLAAEPLAIQGDVQAAADLIETNRTAWRIKGAEIEKIRLDYKRRVDNAETTLDVSRIKQAAVEELMGV